MTPDCIQTSRLFLRPFEQQDAVAVFNYWCSDPSWERFNASVPEDFQLEDAEAFVRDLRQRDRDASPNWAIVYEDEVVGVVSLGFETDSGATIGRIGYGIHADLKGQGITMEAVTGVLTEAFRCRSDLSRVRAHTDAENRDSIRVLEKLGFSRQSTTGQSQIVKGRPVVEAVFGIERAMWSS